MVILKKAAIVLGIVTALCATGITAYAATDYKTSAEIVAELTGRTVQDVIRERSETGKTYGTIAKDAGKLEDFQTAMLDMRSSYYDGLVNDGNMTRQQADAAVAAIQNHHASCDGTGYDDCLLYGTDHTMHNGWYNNGTQRTTANGGGAYGMGGGHHGTGGGHRGRHH